MKYLAQNLKIDEKDIAGISEEKGRGQVVYQWHPTEKSGTYIVVVSRPYWLSLYAEDENKVAWIVIAAYEACGN